MFTNQIGCTVYEKTIGENRMEQYVKHFISKIYWEDKKGQFTADKAMKQSDYVLCIIPETSLSGYIPKVNDLLVCGMCNSAEPPETGTRTIMYVADFRYGSSAVQHLEVTAV
ncbi:MAG: hypothetical protein K2G88_08920 [Oscillospiraceae bacterium]|nr:hypothetical protein [Oscillospiraceae bacterium]